MANSYRYEDGTLHSYRYFTELLSFLIHLLLIYCQDDILTLLPKRCVKHSTFDGTCQKENVSHIYLQWTLRNHGSSWCIKMIKRTCWRFSNEFELTRFAFDTCQSFEAASFDLKCFPELVRHTDVRYNNSCLDHKSKGKNSFHNH